MIRDKGEERIEHTLISLAVMGLLLMAASFSSIPWASCRKGPRQDDLSLTFYDTQEVAYTALTAGEIDFVKKTNSNYKIDIYDLALAGGAFGSTGTGIPSSNWFPGADLAPTGGIIDIYDEVTVTGVNWDQEFDPTEP